jgi:hypothetical protein
MAYYNNSGQVNNEAISIAGGKTFQVIQVADSAGDIIDPAGGPVVIEGDVYVTDVETSVPARVPTTTSIASSATSVTILASNTNRKGLSVSNISTSKLYLGFTSPATSTNCFIEVPPGAFLLLDQQLIVTSAIYGIWAAANGTAQVTEYV